jgi:hypothetical protein
LRRLVDETPFRLLRGSSYLDTDGGGRGPLIKPVGCFLFAPLISEKVNLLAELEVLLLRPGDAGGIVTKGGDIDNSLKTLFDALRRPDTLDELPKKAIPGEDETPFFCLLDNDNLITGVTVLVDRLLLGPPPCTGENYVELLVTVAVKGWTPTPDNLPLIT